MLPGPSLLLPRQDMKANGEAFFNTVSHFTGWKPQPVFPGGNVKEMPQAAQGTAALLVLSPHLPGKTVSYCQSLLTARQPHCSLGTITMRSGVPVTLCHERSQPDARFNFYPPSTTQDQQLLKISRVVCLFVCFPSMKGMQSHHHSGFFGEDLKVNICWGRTVEPGTHTFINIY